MKKSASKSPAISISSKAPAKKSPAAPKSVAATKKSAVVKKPAAAKKSVFARPTKSEAPASTVITARIDIGFGNALHLRGDGPGLSWHQSAPLTCMADDEWVITLPASTQPVVFKFLVNDHTWSSGPDYVVAPGLAIEIRPTF